MIIKIDLYSFYILERKYELDIRDELSRRGITWKTCEVDELVETAVFYGCENVPDELPSYMKIFQA